MCANENFIIMASMQTPNTYIVQHSECKIFYSHNDKCIIEILKIIIYFGIYWNG